MASDYGEMCGGRRGKRKKRRQMGNTRPLSMKVPDKLIRELNSDLTLNSSD